MSLSAYFGVGICCPPCSALDRDDPENQVAGSVTTFTAGGRTTSCSETTGCSCTGQRATSLPATRGSSAAPRWRAPHPSSAPARRPSRARSAPSPLADSPIRRCAVPYRTRRGGVGGPERPAFRRDALSAIPTPGPAGGVSECHRVAPCYNRAEWKGDSALVQYLRSDIQVPSERKENPARGLLYRDFCIHFGEIRRIENRIYLSSHFR